MGIMPSGSTPLQHALAELTAEEAAAIDCREILRAHDAAACDEKWLPWLAWENSIGDAEGWLFAETEAAQRRLIADFVAKHQSKGTPAVIRRLFRDLQLGEIDIIERASSLRWNGQAKFDGTYRFGGEAGDWAKYAVIVRRPVTNKQAVQLRAILGQIAPLRCELVYIDFRSTPLKWDGEITFDGTYNFGAA
nr:MAG TPA: tail protein [Caudoviricetes sp.]